MPLARLLRISDPPQRSALRAGSLPDRPEPALAARRRDDERRRLRRRLVRRRPDPRRLPQHRAGLERPNLHELAAHVSSSRFFTHIRAAIGSAVQQTNCHPFRHGRWLFMHNGYINEFATIKRDLVLTVDPSLYPKIQGQTDTEVLFYLALTFGLEDDPPAAIERAIGLVEAVGSRLGVPHPVPGHDRNDRRRGHLGLPLLDRGQVALALLHDRRAHAAQALSRAQLLKQVSDGRAADRVRAARRCRRRLERGARGELWHRRPRPRRAAPVPPAGAVEVDPRGCLTGRAGDHRGAAVHFTVSVPCIPAARWASTEQ